MLDFRCASQFVKYVLSEAFNIRELGCGDVALAGAAAHEHVTYRDLQGSSGIRRVPKVHVAFTPVLQHYRYCIPTIEDNPETQWRATGHEPGRTVGTTRDCGLCSPRLPKWL